MGTKRKAQNLNIPVKLGNDIFFVGIDCYPANETTDEAMIVRLEKDDGTVYYFKGKIPEITYTGSGSEELTITITCNQKNG